MTVRPDMQRYPVGLAVNLPHAFERLDEELNGATELFLARTVSLQLTSPMRVRLHRLFSWYEDCFGASRSRVLEWVAQYHVPLKRLREKLKAAFQELQIQYDMPEAVAKTEKPQQKKIDKSRKKAGTAAAVSKGTERKEVWFLPYLVAC